MRRLHTVVFGTVIPCFNHLSDHPVRRDIEDPVEMQSSGLSAALPYADMLPTFAVDKVFQGVTQGLLECFLRMQLIRERKGAKEIPFSLQIDFLGQAGFSADGVGLFAFVVTFDIGFPLLSVRNDIFHCFPHISFAFFFRKLLALPICGFKLFLLFRFLNGQRTRCASSLVSLREVFLRGGDIVAPVK